MTLGGKSSGADTAPDARGSVVKVTETARIPSRNSKQNENQAAHDLGTPPKGWVPKKELAKALGQIEAELSQSRNRGRHGDV